MERRELGDVCLGEEEGREEGEGRREKGREERRAEVERGKGGKAYTQLGEYTVGCQKDTVYILNRHQHTIQMPKPILI